MGNTCCCDEDLTSRPVDPNVLVWRPEAAPGKRNVTSAELQKRDELLDAALDRIARHQPDEPSPRQSVPKAAEVAEFRRSQLSQHHQLTEAERCFQEARPHHQVHRPPEKIGEDVDSNEDLAAPSDTSCPQGEVPQHEVHWVTEYHGDAAPTAPSVARAASPTPASPSVSPTSPRRNSTASEGRRSVEFKDAPEASNSPQPRTSGPPARLAPAPAAPQEVTGAAAKSAQAPVEPAIAAAAPAAPPAEAAAEEDDDIPLLPMKFQLPDKSFQDVYFFAFPIGFDLGKQTPLTVRGVKAGSYAEQLGVQAGWKICEIGGVKVGHMKPKDMLAVLAEQKKKHLG